MICDASDIPEASRLCVDYCVIGSGPAAQAFVRELDGLATQILMLESGGLGEEAHPQKFSAARVISPHGYPRNLLGRARRRQLGGMSRLWDNMVVERPGVRHVRYLELDEIDFEARPEAGLVGWPITKKDLEPYYRRAETLAGLSAIESDLSPDCAGVLPLDESVLEHRMARYGMAEVFGAEAERFLKASENIRLMVHATLVDLVPDRECRRIQFVKVARGDGRQFEVAARHVILAGGGVENARMLLLANETRENRLGNLHDQVGRNYMDHPGVTLGFWYPNSQGRTHPLHSYDLRCSGGQPGMAFMALNPDLMRREGLLNAGAILSPRPAGYREGAAPGLVAGSRNGRVQWNRRALDGLAGMPRHLLRKLSSPYYSETRTGWSKEDAGGFECFEILALLEQSPDPENRVMLSSHRDSLGFRQVELHWKWNECDLRSFRRTLEVFSTAFASAGVGEVRTQRDFEAAEYPLFGSPHHFMGTTRMHADPKAGVTNVQAQVHGVDNLHVLGGSLFPTGGFANPTLTVLALSIRLADRLRSLE